jgi:hypothetical protein
VERVLALLPDPFTRKDYERLMRVSAWAPGEFVSFYSHHFNDDEYRTAIK